MKKLLLALSSTLILTTAALAELTPTDRPDFTEGTAIVPPLQFQLETGYTFTYDRLSGGIKEKTHTLPETLLRSGITEDLELRLFFEGYNRSRTTSPAGNLTDSGYTDLNIGTKFNLVEGPKSFAVIADIDLPTGSSNRTSDKVVPTVKLLWATEMSEIHTLAGNINFSAPIDESEDRYFEPSASLTIGKKLSERFSVFYEYFGLYPANTGEASSHFLNGGLTFAATNNIQLDWRVGFGLNTHAEDVFTGAGISIQL